VNFDIFVPITFLLLIFLGLRLLLNQQLGKRKAQLDVLTVALQAHKELPEPLWSNFQSAIDPQRNDLRKALLFVVLGLVTLLLAWIIPFEGVQARWVLTYISGVPIAFALVYLGFWRFWYKNS